MFHYANERFTYSGSLVLSEVDLIFNKFYSLENSVDSHDEIEMTQMIISILSWLSWCFLTFLILDVVL